MPWQQMQVTVTVSGTASYTGTGIDAGKSGSSSISGTGTFTLNRIPLYSVAADSGPASPGIGEFIVFQNDCCCKCGWIFQNGTVDFDVTCDIVETESPGSTRNFKMSFGCEWDFNVRDPASTDPLPCTKDISGTPLPPSQALTFVYCRFATSDPGGLDGVAAWPIGGKFLPTAIPTWGTADAVMGVQTKALTLSNSAFTVSDNIRDAWPDPCSASDQSFSCTVSATASGSAAGIAGTCTDSITATFTAEITA